MNHKKLSVFVIDVKNKNKNTGKKIIKDDLEVFYKIIGCKCIDTRQINGKYFDFIIDDEGALADTPILSAIASNNGIQFYGTVIVCGLADDDGDLTSLTDEDFDILKNHLKYRLEIGNYLNTGKVELLPILCDVNY